MKSVVEVIPSRTITMKTLAAETSNWFTQYQTATAYFDHDKQLLYLESDELDDRTEACSSQEDAEMAFEDYLRGIYDPDPAEINHEG